MPPRADARAAAGRGRGAPPASASRRRARSDLAAGALEEAADAPRRRRAAARPPAAARRSPAQASSRKAAPLGRRPVQRRREDGVDLAASASGSDQSRPSVRGCSSLVEPGLGAAPLAADRLGRDAELRGGLLERQAGEEPQLHDGGLARIDRLQAGQRLVQGQQVGALRRRPGPRPRPG